MIIVALVLFGVSVGVGVYIKMLNQSKIKFKLDILNFCDFLKTQIGFAQKPLKQIVVEYARKAVPELKSILDEYVGQLGEGKEFAITNKDLAADEISLLNVLFNELGKSDAQRQVELCENTKKLMLNDYEDYKNKRQKSGDLGLKLSICAGLIIVILMI